VEQTTGKTIKQKWSVKTQLNVSGTKNSHHHAVHKKIQMGNI
jgi:hypothetical protein